MVIGPFARSAYLAARMLFILSLRGLSTQESARQGNLFGIIGMLVAVVMTALALAAWSGDGDGRRARTPPSSACWRGRAGSAR